MTSVVFAGDRQIGFASFADSDLHRRPQDRRSTIADRKIGVPKRFSPTATGGTGVFLL